MISTRFFLDTRKETKDGTYQLSIVLQQNNKTATIPSGIRLKKGQFDNKKQCVLPTYADYRQLNKTLEMKIASINIELNNLALSGWIQDKSMAEIKKRITGEEEVKKPVTFASYAEEYIGRIQKYRTRISYLCAVKKMAELCDNFNSLTFSDMDVKFFTNLDIKMIETLNPTTRTIYRNKYAAIFNSAIREGVISQSMYPFNKLKKITMKIVRHLVVDIDTLRKIKDSTQTKKMQKYADIFMLSFYLAGINMIDLLYMPKPEDERKLCYYRAKTGVYTEIMIPDEAMAIIDKYKGNEFMLNFIEGKSETQVIGFINTISRSLKLLKDNEGDFISQKLSIYYARHTWSTIAHELDIPDAVIDMALAHKSPYAMSEHYIYRNRKKINDANRLIIDYVNGRKHKAED